VGTLAGLAGLTMLELHCANFQVLHVMLWHTAVMPVSGASGASMAWAGRFPGGLVTAFVGRPILAAAAF
jgi:hypothetical protein